MTKGKGLVTSLLQKSSDGLCRKPEKNLKFVGLSFLGSFFIFCVCVLLLYMNLTFGTSFGLPLFCFLSFSSLPSYKLFQLCFTNLRLGFIFLSRQYSGLSTLLLMTYFIILFTIFHMHLLYRWSQLEKQLPSCAWAENWLSSKKKMCSPGRSPLKSSLRHAVAWSLLILFTESYLGTMFISHSKSISDE